MNCVSQGAACVLGAAAWAVLTAHMAVAADGSDSSTEADPGGTCPHAADSGKVMIDAFWLNTERWTVWTTPESKWPMFYNTVKGLSTWADPRGTTGVPRPGSCRGKK